MSQSNNGSEISQEQAIIALDSIVKIITNAMNQNNLQSEVKAIFMDVINQQDESENLIKILENDENGQDNQA